MKFLTTTLLALTSAVSANAWTLYCGASCTNGTAIVSGTDNYQGAACTNLLPPYDYCYFETEQVWYQALLHEMSDCGAGGGDSVTTVTNGQCVAGGPYLSYIIKVNL